MLRWTIAVLVLANLLAFAAIRGVFGPLPVAADSQPMYLNRQVHPESLHVRPETAQEAAEAADKAVVGAPAPEAPVQAQPLPQ
jgi:hypothetical protein